MLKIQNLGPKMSKLIFQSVFLLIRSWGYRGFLKTRWHARVFGTRPEFLALDDRIGGGSFGPETSFWTRKPVFGPENQFFSKWQQKNL